MPLPSPLCEDVTCRIKNPGSNTLEWLWSALICFLTSEVDTKYLQHRISRGKTVWPKQRKTRAETWEGGGLGFRFQRIIWPPWGFGQVWTSLFTSVKWGSYHHSIRLWGTCSDMMCMKCFVLFQAHTWVIGTSSLYCLFKWNNFCQNDFVCMLSHFSCFWLFAMMVLEKTLESPLDSKEIKPANPKGNQSWIFIGRTDAEADASILWPQDAKNWLTRKDSDAGKDWRWSEMGTTEDKMVGWHHWLDGHEFEWARRVGDGQGSLACWSPWGHKESNKTEWLNCTET